MNAPLTASIPEDGKPGRPYRFVARQPIFTRDEKLFGYELLFRDGIENYFRSSDPEVASLSVLDSSILTGLDVLCGRRRAFLNCTRDFLLNDYVTLLPSEQAVVEILEGVPPDDQVKAACQRLKEASYLIALDDFGVNDPRTALCDFADIIKVDLRVTSLEDAAAMVRCHGSWRCRMLAEKVETKEQFSAAKDAGFLYFQGYFLRKPELVQRRDIPANGLNYLRMLRAASRPELDASEIESLIKSEASLCYRLLRYLNSAVFGFASEIQSVRHALLMLGEREVRRWISMVAILGAGQNRCGELVLLALVRARFCELLSPKVAHGGCDLFLMGLISMMDVLLEMPITQVLENVPVDREIKQALLGGSSLLQPVYRLMLAQESGEWGHLEELAKQLRLNESEVAQAYWEAIDWARQVNMAQMP